MSVKNGGKLSELLTTAITQLGQTNHHRLKQTLLLLLLLLLVRAYAQLWLSLCKQQQRSRCPTNYGSA